MQQQSQEWKEEGYGDIWALLNEEYATTLGNNGVVRYVEFEMGFSLPRLLDMDEVFLDAVANACQSAECVTHSYDSYDEETIWLTVYVPAPVTPEKLKSLGRLVASVKPDVHCCWINAEDQRHTTVFRSNAPVLV